MLQNPSSSLFSSHVFNYRMSSIFVGCYRLLPESDQLSVAMSRIGSIVWCMGCVSPHLITTLKGYEKRVHGKVDMLSIPLSTLRHFHPSCEINFVFPCAKKIVPELCEGRWFRWCLCSCGHNQPYAPAGFISTVSFISPDKKADMALA